jgi:hypothetical protein
MGVTELLGLQAKIGPIGVCGLVGVTNLPGGFSPPMGAWNNSGASAVSHNFHGIVPPDNRGRKEKRVEETEGRGRRSGGYGRESEGNIQGAGPYP